MGSLLYRPDWEDARNRLTRWWNGEDLGRPAMLLTAPRTEPAELIEALPEPPGWVTHYSSLDLEYKVNLALRSCVGTHFLGEAVPAYASGDLAPNTLALYLGCKGVEMPGTTWCDPYIESPEAARFVFDPDNFYWRFSTEAYRRAIVEGRGKFLQQFPDLIEGLDTLAAARGTERLLADLLDRPEWVTACLRQITDRYFHYYDILYDMFRDEVGGSVYWVWAPGRVTKLQCDFSAMISASMFHDFMTPVLREMTERVSYSLYHFDGPCAMQHLDELLSLPRLNMIQWTPGAGAAETADRRWWPLYHRILDAGKKVFIYSSSAADDLVALKREFGAKAGNMLIGASATTPAAAAELLRRMSL
jgi:hypothetical protein